MQKRFYVDTSAWRDFLENRSDGLRPLGEFAFRFLNKCRENQCIIFVSDVVKVELEKDISKERIMAMFSPFEEIIRHISATTREFSNAKNEWIKRGKNLPFNDIFHAVIAKSHGATLVSRDRHFDLLDHVVEVKKPEELIFC
ncbi:MAG: PIN domain-containing protein [Candidatus Diapherotrites archaeon]